MQYIYFLPSVFSRAAPTSGLSAASYTSSSVDVFRFALRMSAAICFDQNSEFRSDSIRYDRSSLIVQYLEENSCSVLVAQLSSSALHYISSRVASPHILFDLRDSLLSCVMRRHEYHIFQKIQKLEYSFPGGYPETARDLVSRLLRLEPTERLGAPTAGGYSALKAHAFFSGFLSRVESSPDNNDQYIDYCRRKFLN